VHLLRLVHEDYARAQQVGERAHAAVKQEWTWRHQLGKVFPEA